MADTPRLLVIDDIELNCQLLQHKLHRHGYEVEVANDGEEGLIKLDSSDIDLILLDLNMPVMNGFTFLEKIKASKQNAHIPVVVFSSIDDEDTVNDCLQYGASGYVSKADDLGILLQQIEKCIAPPGTV